MAPSGKLAPTDQVLIVGGGPAGIATALMLAQRGHTNIVLLERSPSANSFEADKAFVYNICARGQRTLADLGLLDELRGAGVSSDDFAVIRYFPDGSAKPLGGLPKFEFTSYWIPRASFNVLLARALASRFPDQVTVYYDTTVTAIDIGPPPTATGGGDGPPHGPVRVTAQRGDGSCLSFAPRLTVAADGYRSLVRRSLEAWNGEHGGGQGAGPAAGAHSEEGGHASGSGRFTPTVFPSPSGGLRYKVLALRPDVPFDDEGTTLSHPYQSYSFIGAKAPDDEAVRIGILPVTDLSQPRPANFITYANHKLWTLRDAEQMYEFLEASFPQLRSSLRQLAPEEEMARFAASKGGAFPQPQAAGRAAAVLGLHAEDLTAAAGRGQGGGGVAAAAGVVLVGDALHAFPPDLGQGVNSALQDVCALGAELEACGSDLAAALTSYNTTRVAEAQALVRLQQWAFPYQYRQPGTALAQAAFNANVLLRLGLSKLAPALFSPPAVFMLLQRPDMSYEQLLKKAHETTSRLVAVAVTLTVVATAYVLRMALAG